MVESRKAHTAAYGKPYARESQLLVEFGVQLHERLERELQHWKREQQHEGLEPVQGASLCGTIEEEIKRQRTSAC